MGDTLSGVPVIAESVWPSDAFVHGTENDGPLVHADRHGAVRG